MQYIFVVLISSFEQELLGIIFSYNTDHQRYRQKTSSYIPVTKCGKRIGAV